MTEMVVIYVAGHLKWGRHIWTVIYCFTIETNFEVVIICVHKWIWFNRSNPKRTYPPYANQGPDGYFFQALFPTRRLFKYALIQAEDVWIKTIQYYWYYMCELLGWTI